MKRFLSILICLSLILCIPVMQTRAVDLGASFAGGNGTEEDPYLISGKEQLNNVRYVPSAYFRLTADIAFTEEDFAEGGSFYNDGDGWLPIGSPSEGFSGNFDGDGHCISGIRITTSNVYYAGLFGYSTGTIRNLSVQNCEYTAVIDYGQNKTLYFGGFVGYNAGTLSDIDCFIDLLASCASQGSDIYSGGIAGWNTGDIDNCTFSGTIDCSAESSSSGVYSGGIAGYSSGKILACLNNGAISAVCSATTAVGSYAGGISGGTSGSISDCGNCGAVYAEGSKSNALSGGIAGSLGKLAEITCSYNSGSIQAKTSSTYKALSGGIAAENNNGVVSGCCNYGDVYGRAGGGVSYSGGIIARNYGEVENAFNMGAVTGDCVSNDPYIGGIVGDNGYGFGDSTPGSVINVYNVGSIFIYNMDSYYGRVSYSPYAGALIGRNTDGDVSSAFYVSTPMAGIGTSNGSVDGAIGHTPAEMRSISSYSDFDFDTVWEWDTGYALPVLQNVALFSPAEKENTEEFSGGTGAIHDPYRITTGEQLANMGKYPKAHFVLCNDIVFEQGQIWDPVGDDQNPFMGYLNGNGFTVSGLTVSVEKTNGDCAYGGLFGCSGGYIWDLRITDCDIYACATENYSFAGSIAGRNNGVIQNCSSSGRITAYEADCYDGYAYAGGLCGFSRGVISSAYNTAEVTAVTTTGTNTPMAGGITGGNSYIITNCYNTGKITARSDNIYYARAGGITGLNNSYSDSVITNCYNVGTVEGNSGSDYCQVGGIAGYNNGSVQACVYLNTVEAASGYDTKYGSTDALCGTDTKMKAQAIYELAGFDFVSIWTMEGSRDYVYPELRNMPVAGEESGQYMYGDVNGDGEIDILDANLIVSYYNGTTELSVMQVTAADVNGDGEVDILDANLIVAFYNGTLDHFPAAG